MGHSSLCLDGRVCERGRACNYWAVLVKDLHHKAYYICIVDKQVHNKVDLILQGNWINKN